MNSLAAVKNGFRASISQFWAKKLSKGPRNDCFMYKRPHLLRVIYLTKATPARATYPNLDVVFLVSIFTKSE